MATWIHLTNRFTSYFNHALIIHHLIGTAAAAAAAVIVVLISGNVFYCYFEWDHDHSYWLVYSATPSPFQCNIMRNVWRFRKITNETDVNKLTRHRDRKKEHTNSWEIALNWQLNNFIKNKKCCFQRGSSSAKTNWKWNDVICDRAWHMKTPSVDIDIWNQLGIQTIQETFW